MTSAATPTYLQTRTDAEEANGRAMWLAAQTVCSRVPDAEGRAELLGALGLLDVQRPLTLP